MVNLVFIDFSFPLAKNYTPQSTRNGSIIAVPEQRELGLEEIAIDLVQARLSNSPVPCFSAFSRLVPLSRIPWGNPFGGELVFLRTGPPAPGLVE
jgi:hypothetical protein